MNIRCRYQHLVLLSIAEFLLFFGTFANAVSAFEPAMADATVPVIVTQPTSRVTVQGQAVSLSVTASGSALGYRWQRLANDDAQWAATLAATTVWDVDAAGTWLDLNESATYVGVQTATLSINNPTQAMAGDNFRCVVDNPQGSVKSDAVTLSVLPSATVAASVAPLIKTTWNNYQWPLNAYYPLDPSTGNKIGNACGPSSITRLLRYWEFPRSASGSVYYTGGNGSVWNANFASSEYLYDRMPYDLPETAAESVYGPTATLCFHAAAAMEDAYGSGMDTRWLRRMFVKYFHYSPRAYEACRWQYSRAEWIALLKSELDQGHPVLVMARTASSPAPWQSGNFDGHWYVIDGYNDKDQFHYAYGYAIAYDAYCDVDNIGNYNSYHRLLIGLTPDLGGKTLALSAPAADSALKAGDSATVRWTSSGIANLKIEYSTDNGWSWTTAVAGVAASMGSYAWTVPATVTRQACLRLTDASDVNVYRKTGLFEVYDRKEIKLNDSLKDWIFQTGASYRLCWTSTGVRLLKIEYSTDGGASWSLVADRVPASGGGYDWTVPAKATSQAVLRLTDAEVADVSVASDPFATTNSEAVGAYHAADADTVVLNHFEGNFTDASGVVGTPQQYGNLTFPAGANSLGQALRIDNSSSCGSAFIWSKNAALAVSGNWTIELWVKINSINEYTQYPWILHAPANGWDDCGLEFILNPASSSFGMRYKTGAGVSMGWNSIGSYALGQWYHLALVGNASAGTLTAYIHNAQRQLVTKQQVTASAADLALWNTGQDVFVGGSHYSSSNVQFDGWIDELRIVKRATPYDALLAPPTLVSSPSSLTISSGTMVQFQVKATSTGTLAYHWQVSTNQGASWTSLTDDSTYEGTQTAALGIHAVSSSFAGNRYRCVVSDGQNAAVLSDPATLSVGWSQLSALSCRAPVATGDQTLILGFVYAGGGKPTLIRGLGPNLAPSLPTSYLVDPQLQLCVLQDDGSWANAGYNDNWGGAGELRQTIASLGAGPLENDSKDAAIVQNLSRTVYTAQVSGVGGTTGVALAEAYDANLSDHTKRLTALSVRNQVGKDDALLIAGFVLDGNASKTVIVRGVGPGLSKSVPGYLLDPNVQVWRYDSKTQAVSLVGENDNWDSKASTAALFKRAYMGELAEGSKDAAIILTLEPGIYMAQMRGMLQTTGIGLVEIYEAP
jgi:hypothetical protein